jgi:imidazole glycerol-phosphate synthase subunit HisH
MIAVIDYGVGNLGSIQNMLRKAGATAVVTRDADAIRAADKLILPGVGHFDYGMKMLHETGLVPLLNERVVEHKVPILGICLGMQLLGKGSEEGAAPGLGWIDARCIRFRPEQMDARLKVPHMGWTDIHPTQEDILFQEMHAEPRFYFVHTYHLVCERKEEVIAEARYGYPFVCAVRHGHVAGVQFHPEKSHKFGLRLLRNFSQS